ncbi:kinetochore protein Spc25 [Engraulis encrasicolus]|uniref:kinetochore protein Spc25 n=1 Tax=Engraulis encrasicolus TaxID=184585 RepID=UPI002FD24A2F
MACITDVDCVECFNTTLEEIRSKLMSLVVAQIDQLEDSGHTHRQDVKAGLEQCWQKAKDDTIFRTMGMFSHVFEESNVCLKEKRRELPDLIADTEEKGLIKESLQQRMERLRAEQAKRKELVMAQNKANKNRLKELHSMSGLYQKYLALEIRKIHGEKLQFVFRNMDPKDPESPFTFILSISDEGVYRIESCSPPLECMAELEKKLNELNKFSAFIPNVRKAFKDLISEH